MALIVQKYGGSSLATPERIKRVASYIVKKKQEGNQMVVVVSAMGDTTDHLVEMAREICDTPPKREMDMLLSVGERISIALLAMAIQQYGEDAISFTGSQVGIITDTKHTEARILEVKADRLLKELQKNKIVIVAGFQGVSIDKEITTLGRGGSDTTAIALAATLKADGCEIMKDVDGIYVAEPRLIPNVALNNEISYDEMIEMANLGAGVLKTESIEIAKMHKIKVSVGSTFTGKIGTIITDRSLDCSEISGIVGKKGLFRCFIQPVDQQFLLNLNNHLAKHRIETYEYIHNNDSLSFLAETKKKSDLIGILENLKKFIQNLKYNTTNNKGLVSIIGIGLNFNSDTADRIFQTINDLKVKFESFTVSQLRLMMVMDEKKVDETIQTLYQSLNIIK